MQFLNPLVLIALAAAGVPLLLHLLQRRKLRPIEFSTLRFLKELQKTTVRRFKLRQLLLLILRTLIIAFVVLAFARPALRGTIGGFGAHARSTVVILLDNSLSMDARDANGQLFESAQHSAAQIASLLEEGDDAALVRMAEVDDKSTQTLTHDADAFKRSLANTTIVPHVARVHDALRVASAILASSQNPNKEVYVITDGQTISFDTVAGKMPLFDEKTHVIVVHEGTHARRTEDLSVDSLHLLTAVFEPGKPVDVEALVRNGGPEDVTAATVRLMVNGKLAAQRSVRVAAHAVATVPLSATLDATGVVGLSVDVEDDAIEQDNVRYAALYLPRAFRVALVASSTDAAKYVRAALEPDAAVHGYVELTDVATARVGGLDFNAYDAVIFAELPVFSAGDAKRFRAYLERGGGAVIFGAGDVAMYNATAREAGLPAAGRENMTANAPLVFGKVDLEHPIFNGVFEHSVQAASATIAESPHVQSLVKFSEEGAGETVIRLSNGTPFLMRSSVGQGRVVMCAVAPTTDGSDFALKPIFVPIVTRSALYVGTFDAVGESFPAGEPCDLAMRATAGSGTVTVRTPDGSEDKIAPRVLPIATVLPLPGLRRCGVYGLFNAQGEPIGAFAVNPEAREADLTSLSDAELTASIERISATPRSTRLVEPGQTMAGSILQVRFGVELWRACIYAAILCALLEMIVARTSKNDANEN